jgi:transcription initiation factor IIF auxiliary subunit
MLVNQRKIELLDKYRRIEHNLNECLKASDFATNEEGYFMNRKAGKPQFMTDDAIALAAEEFARKDAEKKLARMKTEAVQQTNKGEEGKRKPYLKLTKGRLGTKIRKKDDGDVVVVQQMERDIQGMESMHWKVVYGEKTLEELQKALEATMPNIYDLLYEAFELYTDQRKRS